MKGILCAKHSIGYLPLPKVANTSIKHTMFELEHGCRFDAKAANSSHIHEYFRRHQVEIDAAAFRFLVVRDPIKRFLSAYSNRVVHHRELSSEKIAEAATKKKKTTINPAELPPDPDLTRFIERLDLYQQIPSILVHTRPIAPQTGRLEYFTKVYSFESLSEVQADLSEITGSGVKLRHAQSGGPKLDLSLLDRSQMEKLADYYREDYELLSAVYPVERIWKEWEEKRAR